VQLNGKLRRGGGGENWQQRRAAGSVGVCQPLDLDGTIFVPATLSTILLLLLQI
jgi:hypothetical protein